MFSAMKIMFVRLFSDEKKIRRTFNEIQETKLYENRTNLNITHRYKNVIKFNGECAWS